MSENSSIKESLATALATTETDIAHWKTATFEMHSVKIKTS